MDVAKYIGLFLLKNNFVYIHGLGNLELKKRPATYNGEALEGPSYEIMMTHIGSIDDNLANYIATNEQVSISKASNSLREFSMAARADMQAGKAVDIPGIGKFAEERGKTIFVTDPNFKYTPASIPAMKIARRQDETPFATNADIPAVKPRYEENEEDMEPGGISWMKVTIWIVVLAVLAVLAFLGIRYVTNHDNTKDAPLIQTPITSDSIQQVQQPGIVDTAANMADTTAVGVAPPTGNAVINMNVVLNTYTDFAKAQKRVEKLKGFGNAVELVASSDSTNFYVILPVKNIAVSDTATLMDSLGRTFNPTYGVRVLQ